MLGRHAGGRFHVGGQLFGAIADFGFVAALYALASRVAVAGEDHVEAPGGAADAAKRDLEPAGYRNHQRAEDRLGGTEGGAMTSFRRKSRVGWK